MKTKFHRWGKLFFFLLGLCPQNDASENEKFTTCRAVGSLYSTTLVSDPSGAKCQLSGKAQTLLCHPSVSLFLGF